MLLSNEERSHIVSSVLVCKISDVVEDAKRVKHKSAAVLVERAEMRRFRDTKRPRNLTSLLKPLSSHWLFTSSWKKQVEIEETRMGIVVEISWDLGSSDKQGRGSTLILNLLG